LFPLTHVYICQKVFNHLNNQLILGSTFPDTVIESPLDYHQTHTMGRRFLNYVKKHAPSIKDFALGILIHGIEPRGVDYYCDERYPGCERGFCFKKAKPLIKEVVEKCLIPEEYGWWKAHNFVEMGIELKVSDENHQLVKMLKDAYSDFPLIRCVSKTLGNFFKIDEEDIYQGFIRFSRYLGENPLTAQSLAEKFEQQMDSRHKVCIDKQASAKLIQKCRDTIDRDFDEFVKHFLNNLPDLE